LTKQYVITILTLGALSTVGPFSIDMYLPGFPAIAKDLDTSIAHVQLSLTSYLIGIAVGQLLYGPLLDRFGRKNPLYAGLFIYVAASAICAFTKSIDALIAVRLLQALGGCVGMVAAQALVRDLFPLEKTAQAFSSLSLVVAISPMIAPTAGGYITATFGWHYVFVLLGFLTILILFAVYFVLPEGHKADDSLSLQPKAVLNNFWIVFRQKQFLLYALVGGIATSAPFAYIGGSSDVFINQYGFTEQQYGWLFAFMAFGMIGTTQLNHILLKKFSSQQLIYAALFYQCLSGIILVIGTWQHWYGPLSLIVLMFVFLTGQGLTNPNAMALSLAPFKKLTGSAASLNGFVRMTMGGIVTASVSFLHNNTPLPMVAVMVLCPMIGMIIYISSRKRIEQNPTREMVESESAITI
jgi:DHA1 family bicyclomycin/chloramphenicol resistance-like MFS transporter